jgi:hypothetical protein
MLSERGKTFLTAVIADQNIESLIHDIAYSERITVAIDLHIIVKQLVKEIEEKTGEDILNGMLETSKEH